MEWRHFSTHISEPQPYCIKRWRFIMFLSGLCFVLYILISRFSHLFHEKLTTFKIQFTNNAFSSCGRKVTEVILQCIYSSRRSSSFIRTKIDGYITVLASCIYTYMYHFLYICNYRTTMQTMTPMTAITAADPPPIPPTISSVFVLAESST